MSNPELYQRSLKKAHMGEHPRSRGRDAPGLCVFLRPTKGVGNAGCRRTRSLACKSVSAHEHIHKVTARFTRHSHAMVYAYSVLGGQADIKSRLA